MNMLNQLETEPEKRAKLTEEEKKLLGELEVCRLMARQSQGAMAEVLGVDRTTYNEWINLRRRPGKMNFFNIKQWLKKNGGVRTEKKIHKLREQFGKGLEIRSMSARQKKGGGESWNSGI